MYYFSRLANCMLWEFVKRQHIDNILLSRAGSNWSNLTIFDVNIAIILISESENAYEEDN